MKEVITMPFGMGPAGWFFFPYLYPYWYRPYWTPYWARMRYPYYMAVSYPSPFWPMSKEQEERMLEEQSKALEDELNTIRKIIDELKEKK
jgi:hypothetical protein